MREGRLSVVITGASTGVGRATAIALARGGAEVVLACRSVERGEVVRREIEAQGGRAEVIELELASLASVRRAADVLCEREIDVLINNAGVGGARGLTADGFELAFGTNALGHHLFTRLLLPRLSPSARVVHLGSVSYARAGDRIDLARLEGSTRSLTGIHEYAVSKLAVMLLHHELARRLALSRSMVMSVVADPGDVASDAYRHVPWPARVLLTRRMKSCDQGAETPVFCATSPEVENGGCYVGRARFTPTRAAMHDDEARALWERCARWVGLDPD